MTLLIADGFDTYNNTGDPQTGNQWTGPLGGFGPAGFNQKTRFARGRSVSWNGGLYKTGSINQATWVIHVAHLQNIALNGGGGSNVLTDWVALDDGASGFGSPTHQMCAVFRNDGSILFTRGGPTGTVIATWAGAFVAFSYDSFQFKMTVDGSSGSVEAKKNRVITDSTIDFSATGLNSRGGTSNNYANGVSAGAQNTLSFNTMNDDFFAVCCDGTAPNDWTGDIMADVLDPLFDISTSFIATASGVSLDFSTSTGTSNEGLSANVLYTQDPSNRVIATQGGTLSSASVLFNSGFTGHCKLAVYVCDGDTVGNNSDNLAGTLIGVSNEVTNPSATQTFTFGTPVPIKNGFRYMYGILSDAAFTSKGSDRRQSYSGTGVSYVGGFPTSLIGIPPTTTNTGVFCQITATLTANNAGCVSDEREDGNSTYLTDDGTIGHYDLYSLDQLYYTPSNIVGVQVIGFLEKTNSGGRGCKITGTSGVTSFDSIEFFPITSFGRFSDFFVNDPNTGSAWTVSAINALNIGPKLSS